MSSIWQASPAPDKNPRYLHRMPRPICAAHASVGSTSEFFPRSLPVSSLPRRGSLDTLAGRSIRGLYLLAQLQLFGFERDPTPSNPAVPIRILREILLVIVLGVEKLRGLTDLGADRAPARFGETRLVSASRGFRSLTLCRIQRVDRRAVLGAEVV